MRDCIHDSAVRSIASIIDHSSISPKEEKRKRRWSKEEARECVDKVWYRALSDIQPFGKKKDGDENGWFVY
jgi:hypothetical protein